VDSPGVAGAADATGLRSWAEGELRRMKAEEHHRTRAEEDRRRLRGAVENLGCRNSRMLNLLGKTC
jgi:hypothetical protein